MLDQLIAALKEAYPGVITIQERRKNLYQILVPIYHEDGDIVDVFLDTSTKIPQLTDVGKSVMRLSYDYELNTPAREEIFLRMIHNHGLTEQNKIIYGPISIQSAFVDVQNFTTVCQKVCSMAYFKVEVARSEFYEKLKSEVETLFGRYNPEPKFKPIPNKDYLEVDFKITPNGHPIYIFGVKDSAQARLAVVVCLELEKTETKYRSFVVHQNLESLPKRDLKMLTDACDKQFSDLTEFHDRAPLYVQREIG